MVLHVSVRECVREHECEASTDSMVQNICGGGNRRGCWGKTDKMLHVDCVEADNCREQAHVAFGDGVAPVVGTRTAGQVGFDAVEAFEELGHCLFVCFLAPTADQYVGLGVLGRE